VAEDAAKRYFFVERREHQFQLFQLHQMIVHQMMLQNENAICLYKRELSSER
jgi:hypothetical protein